MANWDGENALDFINGGHARVTDPGPLHAPILSCSIRRDDMLDLIFETKCASDAVSNAEEHPDGAVRLNNDKVLLETLGGTKITLIGVALISLRGKADPETGKMDQQTEVKVHRLEGRTSLDEKARYIIDWVENFPDIFSWPDPISTDVITRKTRSIGRDDDKITLSSEDGPSEFGMGALRCSVDGVNFYLCAGGEGKIRGGPGYFLYDGTPDSEFRSRIRLAVSLALGAYLVELGSTTYTEDWSSLSFDAKSAYSIDKKVFRLHIKPLAPYTTTNWLHRLDHGPFNRMINALFEYYEKLDIQGLAWAYWHAQCATPHIAPVHWGAAIEKLVSRYVEMKPGKFPSKHIEDRTAWQSLKAQVNSAIDALNLSDETKSAMHENVSGLNRVVFRGIWTAVLKDLGIDLSEHEAKAWGRRNDAAHGSEFNPDGQLELIRDIKLLEGIFRRILLRITGGADFYCDYATPGHPSRLLTTPPEPQAFAHGNPSKS